jgi:hypothetical protein
LEFSGRQPLIFEIKILATGILTVSLLVLSINQNVFIYGQKVENQNALVFNVQGLKTSPVTKDFKINGPAWREICPSNQCQIEEGGFSLYVVTPTSDVDSPRVYTSLSFNVHDNITNKDLTPIQKKFAEKYQLSFSCSVNSVNDIIEQANNVIYKCSGDSTFVQKEHKEDADKTYYFQVEGTYDNQSDTLTATGKYDRKF